MNDLERIDRIKAALGGLAGEITNPAPQRIFLSVAAPSLVPAIAKLKSDLGITHLSTISGVDLGETFELLYHFGHEEGNLNVRTQIPKAAPRLPSICTVIPGAVLYEREIQDMFGIVVEGIPDGRRLLLSDDWPEGQYPLRKDWKHVRPEERIPGAKGGEA
jgi:membrane-bound hydrogenase subunit beta